MPDLTQQLTMIVASITHQGPITIAGVNAAIASHNITRWSEQRVTTALLRLAKMFRAQGKLGRMRTALLIALACAGPSALAPFERAGLLLTDDQPPGKFGTFLRTFEAELAHDPAWQPLRDRLSTYQAYHELSLRLARDQRDIRGLLDKRPRHAIKQALALTALAFLRQYYEYDLAADVSDLLDSLGTPEEIASTISTLIALANGQRPLDSLDFSMPITGEFATRSLAALMHVGRAEVERRTIAQQIALFGYRLDERASVLGPVYYLTPPASAFEYAQRLGYIRGEVNAGGWLDLPNIAPSASRAGAAAFFVQRWGTPLAELKDATTPFGRIRLKLPRIPNLYKTIGDWSFFDDVSERERLAQDFLVPLQRAEDPPIQLTPTMPLEDFLRIWRIMQFLALADIAALRPYSDTHYTAFLNSLVRVTKEEDTISLITDFGVDPERAREFLRLVSANVHESDYYDLQYHPLLRIAQTHVPARDFTSPPEIIHLSSIVASTSILRNVQVGNQLRLNQVPHIFVDVIAHMLLKHFKHVRTNLRITTPTIVTDIDVLVLEGNTVYLFECKHSIFPSDQHEMRDSWEDIEQGVDQLHRAMTALRDPRRRDSYLAGWFPGRKPRDNTSLRIVPCVLSSHRIFAGLEHHGIPVRDYSSLARLTESGIISMGWAGEDLRALIHRFRITNEHGLSGADLDDYLSPHAKFFQSFAPFMRPICDTIRLGGVRIARETYVYHAELNEWIAHMEAIGAQRLPDETRTLQVPASVADYIAEKDDKP